MTAIAVERRREQARDASRIPQDVRSDPVAIFALMVSLAIVPPAARELWVDYRLVGIPQAALADRERLTKQAVSLRVRNADRSIRAQLKARAG